MNSPVRPSQFQAMPLLFGREQQFCQVDAPVFRPCLAQHPPRDEEADEPVHVGVFVEQRPVKPARLVVLAVGVVVACCVLRISSPIRIIGIPSESSVSVRKFLTWRLRIASTAGSPVGPSTPQFQLRLSLAPSRLS